MEVIPATFTYIKRGIDVVTYYFELTPDSYNIGSTYEYYLANKWVILQLSSLFTRMKYYCDVQPGGTKPETSYIVMSSNGMQSCITCTGISIKAHLYYENVRVAVHPDTIF